MDDGVKREGVDNRRENLPLVKQCLQA